MCHIRTNTETNVFITYLTDLCLGLYLCTKNSERDRKRIHVERKKIRLDRFFFPHMPSKERGNLYPKTKLKCYSQKETRVMRQRVKQKDFFFSELKTCCGFCCSSTLASSGFQKCWISTTTLEKAKVLPLLKIRPSSSGGEPCEPHFSLFYVAYLAAIYLGNPFPPPC